MANLTCVRLTLGDITSVFASLVTNLACIRLYTEANIACIRAENTLASVV